MSVRVEIFEMRSEFARRAWVYPTVLHLPPSKADEIKVECNLDPQLDLNGRFFAGMRIVVDGAFKCE